MSSLYYLNNIKAIRIADTEKVMVIFKGGCLNESGSERWSILRDNDADQAIFTRQEAMNFIIKKYSKATDILKSKSRSADFYGEGQLVAAFARALNKKDKLNLIDSLTDESIKEKYDVWSHVVLTIREEGTTKRSYQKATLENYEELVKAIEDGEAYYSLMIKKKIKN